MLLPEKHVRSGVAVVDSDGVIQLAAPSYWDVAGLIHLRFASDLARDRLILTTGNKPSRVSAKDLAGNA